MILSSDTEKWWRKPFLLGSWTEKLYKSDKLDFLSVGVQLQKYISLNSYTAKQNYCVLYS